MKDEQESEYIPVFLLSTGVLLRLCVTAQTQVRNRIDAQWLQGR